MFNAPSGIAYDSTNDALYIADPGNNRVLKVTASTGTFVGAIGKTSSSSGTCPASGAASAWCTGGVFVAGTGNGMFSSPVAMAYDSANNALYIADASNNLIVKVTATTGAFVGAIGETVSSTGTCPAAGAASSWCTGGVFTAGTGNGMFDSPSGLAFNSTGNALYIGDTNNNRIVKVTATTGAFVGAIGETVSSTGTCPASGVASSWCTGGVFTAGTGNGMFSNPFSMAYDSTNNALYIADQYNGRIVKKTPP
jgi:DNA-binding beta-propeller fold protein YncE